MRLDELSFEIRLEGRTTKGSNIKTANDRQKHKTRQLQPEQIKTSVDVKHQMLVMLYKSKGSN